MKNHQYFTCVLVCVVIAFSVSSIPGKEYHENAIGLQLRERRVAYRDALQKAFDVLQRRYIDGVDDIGCLSKARIALLEANLAIESASDQRLKMLEEYVDQLKKVEHYYNVRFKNALCREDELSLSTADRIHGEILLLEEQERQQLP